MPLYRRMVETFREKMWLAEPETRTYFSTFIEFTDVWERVLRDALSLEIAPAIAHTEDNVKPFYAHVESTHDRLRQSLLAHRPTIRGRIWERVDWRSGRKAHNKGYGQ